MAKKTFEQYRAEMDQQYESLKKIARRARKNAIHSKKLAQAETRESKDRKRGIREKPHPVQSSLGRLAKSGRTEGKILQGGLPELGKRR